jgi:hypothetical protein
MLLAVSVRVASALAEAELCAAVCGVRAFFPDLMNPRLWLYFPIVNASS